MRQQGLGMHHRLVVGRVAGEYLASLMVPIVQACAGRLCETIAACLSCLPPPRPAMLWDVFCRVIDNFGDIGVGWRLCQQLAARGHTVRLWVDDASALQWMAPGAAHGGHSGVTVLPWERSQDADFLATQPPAQVWVETFGCEIAPEFIAAHAHSTGARGQNDLKFPAWINLEYLSAEDFARRCHGLPVSGNERPRPRCQEVLLLPRLCP